jgi:hypothetical protein
MLFLPSFRLVLQQAFSELRTHPERWYLCVLQIFAVKAVKVPSRLDAAFANAETQAAGEGCVRSEGLVGFALLPQCSGLSMFLLLLHIDRSVLVLWLLDLLSSESGYRASVYIVRS